MFLFLEIYKEELEKTLDFVLPTLYFLLLLISHWDRGSSMLTGRVSR